MAATTARALWITAPGTVEIRAQDLKPFAAGDVLVRTRVTALSRGTERLVLSGRVPASEHARMRAPFQEGEFPFPVKYGYASVGVVEAGPPHLVGRRVFSLSPHQDRIVLPADAVHPVPDGVPDARAALAANMETALNILWDAGAGAGDRVTVVGGGVVGLLTAALAERLPGSEVTVVDLEPARASVAARLGARFAHPDEAPRDQDVVIHCSASEAGLATALSAAGLEATVVEASWYGQTCPAVPLGSAFHALRLTLKSSQVGRIGGGRQARWTTARRLAMALDLLADARLDALLSGSTPFADAADAYPRAIADPATLCHLLTYPA